MGLKSPGMVDRIEKIEPKIYQVQEATEERDRRNQQDQEEESRKNKEKDKFERRPQGATGGRSPSEGSDEIHISQMRGLGRESDLQRSRQDRFPSADDDLSLSFSQRVLVLWGILDLKGKPRVPVIVTYSVVVFLITVSAFLILGILWR